MARRRFYKCDMLQLKNNSPFAPVITLLPDPQGIDTLFVIIRGSFELIPALKIAEKQLPPVLADEYWGEPGESSLKYASELHIGKPSSDAVLVGHAWAPGGGAAAESLVAVKVAERRKIIRVFGDRTWKRGGFTSPEPFESIPLVYERAYGGCHALADKNQILAEERNPLGTGFAGKLSGSEMAGKRLPNFEDPECLLRKPGDEAPPAGLGFVAASWLPRRSFAGTYDTGWQKKRAPYLPLDFDTRFFNCACPELTFDRYLTGGEPVFVQGASRDDVIQFTLPRCTLQIDVKIAGRVETPEAHLETVLIEPDDNRLSLIWRAYIPCDKQALKVEQVSVATGSIELEQGAGA
jgi:hypothetical protein